MRNLILITLLLSATVTNAYDIKSMMWAIDNQDIELRYDSDRGGLRPVVVGHSNKYSATKNLVSSKDESFFLENRNFSADDSRLNVAKKNPDGSFIYTTLHLNDGFVKRATQCKKVGMNTIYGSKYSCFYSSANICSKINNSFKKYSKTFNACKNMIKDLKKLLPFDMNNYLEISRRETRRVKAFAANYGIEPTANFHRAHSDLEELEDRQKVSLNLMAEVGEQIGVCNEFFPQETGSTLKNMEGLPKKPDSLVR